MPRQRDIKPGFFQNDDLAALPPLARILFAGLWCWADREGRIEDRPLKIKGTILPFDDCDADALLASLTAAGFIQRYEVDGMRCIQIASFLKHQRPHPKEPPSQIPESPTLTESRVKPFLSVARCPFPSLPSLPSVPALETNPAPDGAAAEGEGLRSDHTSEPAPTTVPEPKRRTRPKPDASADNCASAPKPKSDHQTVIDAYHSAFLAARGLKPSITSRDGKAVREMLATIPAGEIVEALPRYMAMAGWAAERGWPLHVLAMVWNELHAGKAVSSGKAPVSFEGVSYGRKKP